MQSQTFLLLSNKSKIEIVKIKLLGFHHLKLIIPNKLFYLKISPFKTLKLQRAKITFGAFNFGLLNFRSPLLI